MRRWIFPTGLMALVFALLLVRPSAPQAEPADGPKAQTRTQTQPEAEAQSGPETRANGEGLQIFFMGHRNSQIEPCGCKVKQLGGVQHEATIYESETRGASLRVDVGGFAARRTTPENSMRTRFVLSAMAGGLEFDAINVGRSDLDLGAEFFKSAIEKMPEIGDRLVSANVFVRRSPNKRGFLAYRHLERTSPSGETIRIFITGVTSAREAFSNFSSDSAPHPADDFLIRPPGEALKNIVASAGREADLRVALIHAPWEETLEIVRENPDIDIAVVAAREPMERRDTKIVEGNAWILPVHNSEGKVVGLAEFARPERTKPHADASSDNNADTSGGWELPAVPRWIDISVKIPEARDMVQLIENYKASTSELMILKPSRPRPTFAGAMSCRSCHLEQFNDWAGTRHANALRTLVDKGMQFSGDCLKCHTLGYTQDNGFYNVKQSMTMANVQCESCHGPAREHIDTQYFLVNRSFESISDSEKAHHLRRAKGALPTAAVAETTCTTCHTPENDGHFVYDAKRAMIDHK